MNRMVRAVMRLFGAPHVNMREDYPKVRRVQSRLLAPAANHFKFLDREITAADGSHVIPVRVFQPKERTRKEVLLFFHGGGWVTGDIETYTPACATMATLTGCAVASVDYRLAPEHPFPHGLRDCYRVASLLLDEPERAGIDDADNIVLVGDSAGGNLAAAVSLLRAERGLRGVRRQILFYPVTHWDHDPATSPFESVRKHGTGYRLTNAEVTDYLDLYAPDPEVRRDPLVAPLCAAELSGQPDTLVVTAELDLLCDEGEAYGRALAAAGNTAQVHRVLDAVHGFINLPRIAHPMRDAYARVNAFLDETAASGGGAAPGEEPTPGGEATPGGEPTPGGLRGSGPVSP